MMMFCLRKRKWGFHCIISAKEALSKGVNYRVMWFSRIFKKHALVHIAIIFLITLLSLLVFSIRKDFSVTRQTFTVVLLVGFVVGFSGLLVTWWFAARTNRYLETFTAAVRSMSEGETHHRILVPQGDEFGTLARELEALSKHISLSKEQLSTNTQHQTAVLQSMIEGVIAVDGDFQILFANHAAGEILSFHPNDAAGRTFLEVVRSHDLYELVKRSLEQQKLCSSEVSWQADTLLTLEIHATPIPGSPRAGVVLVIQDISELKRLESLRQQFVANVSHELKTPLSSIKAYTETLLEGALHDKKHAMHFLQRIDGQADRLHELILDMLSITRIESGASAIEMKMLSLSPIVKAALLEIELRAQAKGIVLTNEFADKDFNLQADEEALQQILGNLLDNAIKYTPSGGSIVVRCYRDETVGVLEIIDTGTGIAEEHFERLFERFYRVDKARSRELGGTGLGLSIVKHLCQIMGGSVSVQSEPGKGSTFRVRLPLA